MEHKKEEVATGQREGLTNLCYLLLAVAVFPRVHVCVHNENKQICIYEKGWQCCWVHCKPSTESYEKRKVGVRNRYIVVVCWKTTATDVCSSVFQWCHQKSDVHLTKTST